MESVQQTSYPSAETDAARSAKAILGPLCLSPDQIDAPAFFVDNTLSIRWIASGGCDPFSAALAQELRSSASRNVFNLLLRPAIKHAIADWRSFFSFIYANLGSASATASDVNPEFPVATPETLSAAIDGNTTTPKRHAFMVDSCLIGADEATQRVFSVAFDKGTVFMLRQDRWEKKTAVPVHEKPVIQATLPAYESKTICVLSARLNDSPNLARTMLPGFFLGMMNRIRDEIVDIVRALGGKRAPCNGPRLCYVFSESAGRNPIFSAICCATRIDNQMRLLERKLTAQYGWSNEIRLNVGIGHGADDQTETAASSAVEFVIPGGAFEQSELLSDLAGKGEVWITQQAAAQLPKHLIDQVVLGVDQQGHFLGNFFKRISDLQHERTVSRLEPGMQDLSAAQIKKLERHIPEQSIISEV